MILAQIRKLFNDNRWGGSWDDQKGEKTKTKTKKKVLLPLIHVYKRRES